MERKRAERYPVLGTALMTLGAVLVLGALLLQAWNQYEAWGAENAAQEILPALVERIAEGDAVDGDTSKTGNDSDMTEIPMKTKTINGYDYIGFLSIPSMQLELPVMDRLDMQRLKIASCRYSGTLLAGNLVIAGHNYPRTFGKVKKLEVGDVVLFTDVDGVIFSYQVSDLETLQASQVEEMKTGEWDLTLFTCTQDRAHRVAIRCVLSTDGKQK